MPNSRPQSNRPDELPQEIRSLFMSIEKENALLDSQRKTREEWIAQYTLQKKIIARSVVHQILLLSMLEFKEREAAQDVLRKHVDEMLKFAIENPLEMSMMADANGHSIIDKVIKELTEFARKQEELAESDAKRLNLLQAQLERLEQEIAVLQKQYDKHVESRNAAIDKLFVHNDAMPDVQLEVKRFFEETADQNPHLVHLFQRLSDGHQNTPGDQERIVIRHNDIIDKIRARLKTLEKTMDSSVVQEMARDEAEKIFEEIFRKRYQSVLNDSERQLVLNAIKKSGGFQREIQKIATQILSDPNVHNPEVLGEVNHFLEQMHFVGKQKQGKENEFGQVKHVFLQLVPKQTELQKDVLGASNTVKTVERIQPVVVQAGIQANIQKNVEIQEKAKAAIDEDVADIKQDAADIKQDAGVDEQSAGIDEQSAGIDEQDALEELLDDIDFENAPDPTSDPSVSDESTPGPESSSEEFETKQPGLPRFRPGHP